MSKNREKQEDSQEESQAQQEKRRAKDGRARQYAFVVYPDSAFEDWIQRLDDLHIEAFISPLHDQDENPDGSVKKPHWHVMLMFDNKKSLAQIDAIREHVIGPNFNRGLEEIGSMRGYSRYLIHMDNPEKHQYQRADVISLCGADFDAAIALPGDDVKMMSDIFEYIDKSDIFFFDQLMMRIRGSNPDWFSFLVQRRSYVVVQFLKSRAARARVGASVDIDIRNRKGVVSDENQN